MTLSHYELVPPNVQQQIIAQYAKKKEEEWSAEHGSLSGRSVQDLAGCLNAVFAGVTEGNKIV
jgi:hypothetical protein